MASQWRLLDPEVSLLAKWQFTRFARSLGSNKPATNEIDTYISDACPKKYMLFDRSGGRERVIVHPELMERVCDMPSEITGQSQHELLSGCHLNVRVVEGLRNMLEIIESMNQVNKTTNRESSVAACKDVQETHEKREFFPVYSEKRPPCRRSNELCSNQSKMEDDGDDDYGSSLHEDTADLDALLESDEESSTAYSPSDITWTSGPGDGTTGKFDEHLSKITASLCEFESDEESEVSSFSHEHTPIADLPFKTFSGMPNGSFYMEESDSSYSDNRERYPSAHSKFLRIRNSSMKCSARRRDSKVIVSSEGPWTLDGRSRRNKIKTSVDSSGSILPCAHDKSNTVVIIDETIGYVRFLHQKSIERGSNRVMQAIIKSEDLDTKSTQDSESCISPSESSIPYYSLA